MSTTVGDVFVDIRAKVDKLQSDMAAARGHVKSAAGEIQSTANTIQGYLAAIGVGAFAGYIKSSIDAAGALADLSQKTGISASSLSALDYAAKMSGTNIEGVATGLKGLSKNMVEASNGSAEAKEAFKALGISVTDNNGVLKTNEQVMFEVADKFKGLDDGAQQSALAMKIFGKSGQDLIPLLNEGAAGIKEMMQTAEDLGLVISDDTASAMESLGDKFDTVKLAGEGFARKVATSITPALTVVADAFVDSAKQGGILNGAVKVLGDAFKALVTIGIGVVATFDQLGNLLGGTAAAAVQALSGDFKGAGETIKAMKEKSADLAVFYDNKMSKVWAQEVEGQKAVKKETEAHTNVKKTLTKEQENAAKKTADVIAKLREEEVALGMTTLEAAIYKKQKEANVTANSKEGQEIATLVTKLESERDWRKLTKDAAEIQKKAEEELTKARQEELNKVIDQIEKEEERQRALGLSKSEIAALTLAELEHKLQLAENEPFMEAEIASLEARIEKQREYIEVLQKGEVADLQKKQAEDTKKAWGDSAKDIEKALTDSLMRGFESGKGFVQSLWDYIKNAFKTNAVKVLVAPVMGAINSVFSPSAMAGQGGSSGGGLMDLLGGGKSIYDMLSGGFTAFGNGIAQLWAQAGAGLYQAGFTNAGYSMLSSTGTVGTIGSYAGGVGAGMMAGQLIGGKYELGGSGTAVNAIGTAIGAALGGPLGAAIGGAVGGLVNRAFGRGPKEATESGITGAFGGGNFTGQQYQDWKQKGGWFRSDKSGTDYSAISSEVESLLDAGANGIVKSIGSMAEALKLPTEAISGITTQIKVKLTGEAAADTEAITAALTQYEEALTAGFAGALAPFQRAGETLTATMQRLVVLQTFSETINEFGGIFSAIAGSSLEARESMIALAGGIEALMMKAQSFVENYYSQDEQMGMAARAVLQSLEAAGISTATLTGKQEFRALVESMDVSTQTGREQLSTLLDIAPQFAQLTGYMEEQGLTLEQLAELSPEMAILGELFATKQDESIAASETAAKQTADSLSAVESAVTSGANATVEAINTMTEVVSAAVSAAIGQASANAAASASMVASQLAAIESNSRLAASAP